MKPPPKIEAEGLRAFDQVCAFERLKRRRLPVIYCAFTLMIVLGGFAMLMMDDPVWALLCLLSAIGFSLGAWLNWKKLTQLYAKNIALLAELENTYGDQLPWVQVENHFAALEQLKRDLEQEKQREAK